MSFLSLKQLKILSYYELSFPNVLCHYHNKYIGVYSCMTSLSVNFYALEILYRIVLCMCCLHDSYTCVCGLRAYVYKCGGQSFINLCIYLIATVS